MQPSDQVAAPSSRSRAAPALLLALTSLTVYSYLRGQRNAPEIAGEIYYFIDYSNGLIRRGLIGQLFMFVFTRGQATQTLQAALVAHRAVCFALMLGTTIWLWSRMWANTRFGSNRLAWIYVVFVASQFYPTLAATNTYLDAYVLLLLLGGFAATAANRPLAACACGFLSPFIHDMSVITWVPLVLMIAWRDGPRALIKPRNLAVGAAPFIAQMFLSIFETKSALTTQLARAPLPQTVRDAMATGQLGNSLPADLAHMASLWGSHPLRATLSVLLFSLPTLVMLALARPALDRRALAYLALAALAPLSILILAYDLSRFVVVTQFTTMMAILFVSSTPRPTGVAPDHPPSPTAQYATGSFAALLLALPLIYGYFDTTLIISNQVLDNVPVMGTYMRAIYAAL